MTATEITFLEDLKDAQVTFADSVSTQIWISDPNLLSVRKTKVTLLEAMIEIIVHWFRDTNTVSTTDANFFTSAEIQDVIDHANYLMDTVLYISLDDY